MEKFIHFLAWILALASDALASIRPREIFSRFYTVSGFALKSGRTRRDGLRRNRRPWYGRAGSRVLDTLEAFERLFHRGPASARAGAINLTWLTLPTVTQTEDRKEFPIDLDPGVPTSELRFRLFGTLNVAGATPAGVEIFDDSIQRLLPKVRLEYDGIPIVRDIPLRDLHQIWLHHVNQEPTQNYVTDAEAAVAGDYPFELHTGIPFATKWLRRPWDTHLPPIVTKNGLRLVVTFDHTTTQAGDSKGTGAFIKTAGTTAVYTWTVRPTLEIYQMTHPRQAPNSAPVAIRHYSQFVTDDWAAATALLTERLKSERAFDLQIFRTVFGANDELADLIEKFSMKSTKETFYDLVPREILKADESSIFFAVPPTNVGYFGIPFARDGMVTNVVRPSDHRNLRYEFQTAAPASGTGKIVYTSCELVRPGEASS